MPLSAGIRLGPYEILAPIGAGGMGEVWKARDTRLDRIVAIKQLKGQHNARFQQEARAIAALNHPNICQIYDVGPDYLVLEYVEGAPVKGPLPTEEARRLALQIVSAIESAHKSGILHRDLKPANIMVTAWGSAKLLDFGLAKVGADSEATQTMGVLGTPAYMAPEQAEGKPADQRSDVFSFGAVLYEVLAGRRPFDSLAAVLRDEPKSLDTPSAMTGVAIRCLAKSPEDRFQTIAEVRIALEQISTQPVDQQPSIAVLPFSNLTADKANEYFSDGLTEEIINTLAQISGLKVTARTSAFAFRGKEQDIQKIAEALHVRTVLEGSVRRSGSRIRVMAQLISAEDGYHIWSQRYDREMADLFDLQDEIAQAITLALQVKLSGTPTPAQHYRPNLPAYEAFLKARYYTGNFNVDLLPRVRECYEQAIALDPKFALAHCAYGLYFMTMATVGLQPANQVAPMVRSHARKALALDPSLAEGYAMLGVVAGYFEHDWKESEKCFQQAMTRVPVPELVNHLYAIYQLVPTGRHGQALQLLENALQEDPLDLTLRLHRGACLQAGGRPEDAVQAFREILELNPNLAPVHAYLSLLHVSQGDFDQALTHGERSYRLSPQIPQVIGALAGLLKRTGDEGRAQELLGKLQPAEGFGVPRGIATYYWMAGDMESAADWIEKAIDQGDPFALTTLRFCAAQMRHTPRWAAFERKLNLAET